MLRNRVSICFSEGIYMSLSLFKVPPCPPHCFCHCCAVSSSTLPFACLFHLLFGCLHWNESCISATIFAHSLFIPILSTTLEHTWQPTGALNVCYVKGNNREAFSSFAVGKSDVHFMSEAQMLCLVCFNCPLG